MITSNLPKGTIRIMLATISQYVVMALFYMFTAKTNILSQADIGVLSILTFLSSTFSLLTILELPTALTKFISEKFGKNQKEDGSGIQKTVTKTVMVLSIAGFTLTALFSPLLSNFFLNSPDYIIILILNFVFASLQNMLSVYRSTLQALYFFGKMAVLNITFILTSRIIAIAFAMLNFGVLGVIIGYIFGSIIALMLSVIFLKGKFPTETKHYPLKPLLSFSFPLFLSSITSLILQWADVVILTSLTDNLSITGVYHIVVNSVGMLSILYIPITTTLFPALSSQYGLKNSQNIADIVKTTSRYLFYLLIPIAVGLAIIAPTALSFFYGANYVEGGIPLAILSFTAIIMGLIALFRITFQSIGKTREIFKIDAIAAILMLILLFSFVSFFETSGAAFARLITQTTVLLLVIFALMKEIKLRVDKEALWKSIISTLATVPFLVIIELFVKTKISIFSTLVLEIFVVFGVYVFSLYSLKALNRQDFNLLRQAFPDFLGKYISFFERIVVRQ